MNKKKMGGGWTIIAWDNELIPDAIKTPRGRYVIDYFMGANLYIKEDGRIPYVTNYDIDSVKPPVTHDSVSDFWTEVIEDMSGSLGEDFGLGLDESIDLTSQELEDNIEVLSDEVDDLEDTVVINSGFVADLYKKMEGQNKRITELDKKIDDQNENIKTLSDYIVRTASMLDKHMNEDRNYKLAKELEKQIQKSWDEMFRPSKYTNCLIDISV